MKKNYYAVREGRKPGIYKTWNECHRQIDGYSGARFKGFATRQQAEAWMASKKVKSFKAKTVKKPANRGPWKPKTTNQGMKNLYFGGKPPWEYPTFIGCIDYEVNINNFSWKTG